MGMEENCVQNQEQQQQSTKTRNKYNNKIEHWSQQQN